jgi:hypothetical protein
VPFSICCRLGQACSSLTGDEAQAEAVLAQWPPAAFLALFGLTLEEVDPFYAIFAPIAASLDLRYEWQRSGQQVTLRFSR